jgi:4-amino-4-deoxy-L-arabinose transferase-like glycosyltransferase
MRGFVIGLFLLLFVVISVLSLRPGGLRNQLRNVARRFKIALLLAGVFLVASALFRLLVPDQNASTLATAGVGLVLALVFVLLAQERQLPS